MTGTTRNVAGAIAEAISVLRASGHDGPAAGLEGVLERLRNERPVAWAVSWFDDGRERLQAFQRRDVALAWLDDRRVCNADLEAALVFPVFRGLGTEADRAALPASTPVIRSRR